MVVNTCTKSEVINHLQARANIYNFLRLFYVQPPKKEDLLQFSLENPFNRIAKDINSKGCQILSNYFTSTNNNNINTISRSESEEYQRLFIGPDQLPAPPWESVYLSSEGLVFEKQTLEVREFYHRYNLEFKHKNKEPDDHIGIELEFMGFLIDETLKFIRLGDITNAKKVLADQADFLQRHLLKWVPSFCNDLIHNTNSSLYKGLAIFTLEFLPCDYDIVLNLREGL